MIMINRIPKVSWGIKFRFDQKREYWVEQCVLISSISGSAKNGFATEIDKLDIYW